MPLGRTTKSGFGGHVRADMGGHRATTKSGFGGHVKLEFEVHAVVHWRARREVDVGWVGYAATV